MKLPKIFIWPVPLLIDLENDVVGYAVSEDGCYLASHCSSTVGWCKIDMTDEYKKKNYEAHYPDGYEIEFIEYEDAKNHAGLNEALKKLNNKGSHKLN